MGKWVHRLSHINKDQRTASCASCGIVRLAKYNEKRFCCINARNSRRPVGQDYVYSPTKDATNFCEICGKESAVYYDHNHQTGLFRGWLCNKCNLMIGYADDSVDILQSAIEYLKNTDGQG